MPPTKDQNPNAPGLVTKSAAEESKVFPGFKGETLEKQADSPFGGPKQETVKESTGDTGWRIQNVTAHMIGEVLPGAVLPIDDWPVAKMDRLARSSAVRARDLKILKPGEKQVQMQQPDFPLLSRFKEDEAIAMVHAQSNPEVLKYWIADDDRPAVQTALGERIRAL